MAKGHMERIAEKEKSKNERGDHAYE